MKAQQLATKTWKKLFSLCPNLARRTKLWRVPPPQHAAVRYNVFRGDEAVPDLPGVEHWFSATPLYMAISFGFATIVSILGLRDKISNKSLFTWIAAAACLSLVAWFLAAQQDMQSTELKSELVRIADSLKINSNTSVKSLADEILKHLPAKYPLTDDERERLNSVLANVPVEAHFPIELYWPQLNGTHGYADTLAKVFTANKWEATVKVAGLVNGHGLTFAVSKNVAAQKAPMPPGALRLMELLNRARIPVAVGAVDNATDDIFAFVVGEPQVPQD